MRKTVVLYGVAIALAAFLLQWLDYSYAVRSLSGEFYVLLVAVGFTVLGIWVGQRLTRRTPHVQFSPNREALDYLEISEREYEVLELLAAGHSNREIGEKLFVSPNTVKTHLKNLYAKLEVRRRTQAVSRARELRMIP